MKALYDMILSFVWLFHDGGRYHIETKSMDWFLYDDGLRHERVKKCYVWSGCEILFNSTSMF